MCFMQLMMPDTLTEESDADDVSGPNTACSVPGMSHVNITDLACYV